MALSKQDLKPFFRKRIWACQIMGLILLIVSPILFPALILWYNRKEFKLLYIEAFDYMRVK